MVKLMYIVTLMLGFLFFRHGSSAENPDKYTRLRERMVTRQIRARGVKDERVLSAMLTVPRHLFVPSGSRAMAYEDMPLPIGGGQTLSQPYIVAFMTEALDLSPDDRVLEIGTGSGYQAAVLAGLVKDVYTIELIPKLGNAAGMLLDELGYTNIHVRVGDGYKGWPEEAPFDAVIVTCAPERIPQALVDQLAEGGRIIVPVGARYDPQHLMRGVKENGRLRTENMLPVRFVPMVRGKK